MEVLLISTSGAASSAGAMLGVYSSTSCSGPGLNRTLFASGSASLFQSSSSASSASFGNSSLVRSLYLHIVLLDSDCVPVTLFEVEDLWQEAQRLQHCGFPGPVPTSSCAGGLNLDQADQSPLPKSPKEQGVILVTEHNAEVNAGFVVLRGSNHAPPLLEADWQSIPLGPGDLQELAIGKYQQRLVSAYWQLVSTMVSHGRDDRNMTPTECQAWIQTGLALTPFCGHVMNTSLEWAVAWSLVGEWTTRTIFLPCKGEWQRQGHPKALISPYDQRSVPMLTWARACFEQGSLPSLLALPGEASLLVLPGDGMFQAQRIVNGKCRPVILHGYGGAKKEMPTSLAALAKFGWIAYGNGNGRICFISSFVDWSGLAPHTWHLGRHQNPTASLVG